MLAANGVDEEKSIIPSIESTKLLPNKNFQNLFQTQSEEENAIAAVLDAVPKEMITIDNPYSNFSGEIKVHQQNRPHAAKLPP